MFDCIVPAAGASVRMGRPKQLLDCGGEPLLARVVSRALGVVSRCIVVIASDAHAADIDDSLQRRFGSDDRVLVVQNQNRERGMMSSILTGLGEVCTPWFYVAPGDMPNLPADAFATLAQAIPPSDAARPPPPDALFPVYEGRRGHPALIRTALIRDWPDRAVALESFRAMRDLLRGRVVVEIPVASRGITQDIDTPEDYDELLGGGGEPAGTDGAGSGP